jgi:GH24 family phage-related lysozyme (muramidase)
MPSGPQFDELKLQVSLTDNASPQLKLIKQQLDELGSGGQNRDQLKRQFSELDEALKKMIETVSKGPRAFLDLSRNVAVAGLSLGVFTLAAERTMAAVGGLTKSLLELGHAGRLSGLDPAVIKQWQQIYERAGMAREKGRQEAIAFAEAMDDLARSHSRVREEVLKTLANEPIATGMVHDMFEQMSRLPNAVDKAQLYKTKINEIHDDLERRGMKSLANQFLRAASQAVGAPGLINIREDFKPIDDAMSAHMKKQIEQAEKYKEQTAAIAQNWKSITNSMTTNLMDSGLVRALNYIDELLKGWVALTQKKPSQADIDLRTKPPPVTLDPMTGLPMEGYKPQAPGPTPTPPTTPPTYDPMSGAPLNFMGGGELGGGGTRGGGVNVAGLGIPKIGDLLAGGQPITAPGGNFAGTGWRGMPMSRNVVDLRQTQLADRGNQLLDSQNNQTRTLVSEIKRLNALLSGEEKPGGQKYGMLDPSLRPGARGPIPSWATGTPSGTPSGDGKTPGGTRDDGKTQPPATAAPATPPGSAPGGVGVQGPYGKIMPPWGTTTTGPADYGGGTGKGVAGDVPGLPGGPSGRALTPEERKALGSPPATYVPGKTALVDERGNFVDHDTLVKAEEFGRKGDVAGLQRLFNNRKYQIGGVNCGILATKFAKSAGFAPPKDSAIATRWHEFGEGMNPEDVNKPGRPMGSMFATSNIGTYGSAKGRPLRPGELGGHVMTVVPGTYDPKTQTVQVVDQYGVHHTKFPIKQLDFRYAGDAAVQEAERKRTGQPPAAPTATPTGVQPPTPPGASTAPTADTTTERPAVPADLTALVKQYEVNEKTGKYYPTAYKDIGGPSIGYGTAPQKPGERITEAEASKRLETALQKNRAQIEALNPNLSEGSKKALTSLLFNLGSDANKLKEHGMMDAILRNDVEAMKRAHVEFSHIHGPRGPVAPGLLRRRKDELRWYDEKTAAAAAPPPAAPAATGGGAMRDPATGQLVNMPPGWGAYYKPGMTPDDVKRAMGTTPPPTAVPQVSTKSPPPPVATSLYDKLRQESEDHKQETQRRDAAMKAQKLRDDKEREKSLSSRADLNRARQDLDRILGPKKVEGNGEIRVNVRHGPRVRKPSVLKHVPLSTYSSTEKSDPGPPAPKAATGESHDAALDS